MGKPFIMQLINNLTDSPRQSFQVPIEAGGYIQFNLYYFVTQKSWFFDFTYNNYTAKCNKVVLSPNTLRHLKNIIPFGLAFMAEGNVMESGKPADMFDNPQTPRFKEFLSKVL